jgi:hypothetical protein
MLSQIDWSDVLANGGVTGFRHNRFLFLPIPNKAMIPFSTAGRNQPKGSSLSKKRRKANFLGLNAIPPLTINPDSLLLRVYLLRD